MNISEIQLILHLIIPDIETIFIYPNHLGLKTKANMKLILLQTKKLILIFLYYGPFCIYDI